MFNIFKKKNSRIYFDHASSTLTDENVLKKYLEISKKYFANPSSIHNEGEDSKKELFEAKKRVAKCIKARSGNVHFVGSTTEANNIFIKGVFLNEVGANFLPSTIAKNSPHLIYSSSDHSAIVEPVLWCKSLGAIISNVVPNKNGLLKVESILKEINENTKLICFSYVNSEMGAIQDVKRISQEVKKYCQTNNFNVPKIFIDATQVIKYFEVDVHSLGVDGISFGLSKIGGVAGVSVLWIKNGTKINQIISGGGQEEGVRSGTENLAAIVSNSFLLEKITDKEIQSKNREYVYDLKNYFIKQLEVNFKVENDPVKNAELYIFGDTKFKYNKFFEDSAPHILMISLKDILGEELCLRLDAKNISVSPGTACSLLEGSGSSFLKSLNEPVLAKETIRISFSEKNTKVEVDYFIKILLEIKNKYQKL